MRDLAGPSPRLASPFKEPPPTVPSQPALPVAVLATLIAAYIALFLWLSLRLYYAFQMHALDMGNMGQAAWNTIHGHPFFFTNMRPLYGIEAFGTTTRLSFHVEAIYPIISLVYLIYPHPESLIVLQTIALGLGAVPVFLLARDILRSSWLAVVFAASYLLFPAVESMNLYEFHPVALATPLLLFAFWCGYRRWYIPYVLLCLAAIGTKEEIGLVVAVMSLYLIISGRNWRVGLGTALFGVFWTAVSLLVIEKHYRAPGTKSYLASRYGYLGHGVHGVVHSVLHNPDIFFQVAFSPWKMGYVERLLAPVGFLPIFAPLPALISLPTVAINLLSADFHMTTGLGQDSAEIITFMMIAGIYAVSYIIHASAAWFRAQNVQLVLGGWLLVAALVNQHLNGYTPFGASFSLSRITDHQLVEQRFVAMVPPGVPVSTQDLLDPALSSRHYLYLFSDMGGDLPQAHIILLDASGPTYPLPSYQLHDSAVQWLRKPGWGVKAADDGLILIERGPYSKRIPPSFYSFAHADGVSPPHRLHAMEHGLEIVGYKVRQTDTNSHYVPTLAYTFYLKPTRRVHHNYQPVLFQTMGGSLVGCSSEPLGLAWLPTSKWKPGHTYAVRMQRLETTIDQPGGVTHPGTAHLSVELMPVPTDKRPHPNCGIDWARRGKTWPAGALNIHFW